MGLFSKKKPAPQAAPSPSKETAKPAASAAAINPDDIWNKPRKKKPAFADESSEAMTEPVSIDPETIKKKMEALEKELEEQKNKPASSYEPISSVVDEEVASAQEKYEEQYRIEHEKYIETHQQDIDKAIGDEDSDEVQQRIESIVQERDRRAEEAEKIRGDIKETDDEQLRNGMNELGVAKDVTLDPDYKNINEVGADEVAEKLEGLGVAKDESLEPDYKNIKEISDEDVEAKTREFLEKYGDRVKA